MANTQQMASAIRALAMDAVQLANSGHPGAPMGMADMATALWGQHLKHSPTNPHWMNRDRFVLSNGHGSMLIYALLHLSGYKLPMSELKNFRQLHSKTAGHPEVGITPGVETTTGPLGQGITNAVGMALAEKLLGVWLPMMHSASASRSPNPSTAVMSWIARGILILPTFSNDYRGSRWTALRRVFGDSQVGTPRFSSTASRRRPGFRWKVWHRRMWSALK